MLVLTQCASSKTLLKKHWYIPIQVEDAELQEILKQVQDDVVSRMRSRPDFCHPELVSGSLAKN